MRETLVLASLVTHTLDPSGLTATPTGPEPTVIVLVTRLVEVLIRETVVPWPPPLFVTHTLDPSGLTATKKGNAPTAMVLVTA
jgi:hypothetical protein